MNVAINGFGRIGRVFLRAALERKTKFQVKVINDTAGPKNAAYLLKHDSTYGEFPGKITAKKDSIVVNGKTIKVVSERDPLNINWKQLKIDLVIESTGAFKSKEGARKHIISGAKKVIITAPSEDSDISIVPGVNDKKLNNKHKIINMCSCTSNCLAIMAKVLNDKFKIKRSFYTTAHAYTNDQSLQDSFHKKTRRGRAAANNIIPTSSGASISVVQVIPELKNRLKGLAIRVPTITGSVTDLVAELKKPFTEKQINSAFKKASQSSMKKILSFTEEEIVSSDIIKNPNSCIIDGLSTMKDGNLVKVLGWYDNEYGYSNRLVDLIEKIKFK
jgi:glyceraldehyde 3-phosphate dehydrogenase